MKKKMNITVKTLPNGYSLEFDGMRDNGYMYHTADALLKGFMVHIGMEITDQLDMSTVDDFIVAAIKWKYNEKNVEEIKRLTDLCKRQESFINSRQREILKMRKRLVVALDLIKVAIKEDSRSEQKKTLQNAVRAIGTVKAISKKEQELLDTPDETGDDEEDE